jgi:hypothetical protein
MNKSKSLLLLALVTLTMNSFANNKMFLCKVDRVLVSDNSMDVIKYGLYALDSTKRWSFMQSLGSFDTKAAAESLLDTQIKNGKCDPLSVR